MDIMGTAPAEVLAKIKDLVNRTYEAKLVSEAAEGVLSNLKQELTALMETSGVDKFTGDNATVSGKMKSSVSVPKDMLIKDRVFDYIHTNYGPEVLKEMLTINPASFNSWYNAESDKKLSEGDLDFNIEGLKPHSYYSVGFRKR
jgi:hypothetical protein